MTDVDKFSHALSSARATPARTPFALVATVVRVDGSSIWAHVDGEVYDRGPLLGSATPAVGAKVLIGFPANATDPWIIA
jgi:hypothetical protein